jgi:uncharacterized protein (DUF697 family)
MNKKTLPKAIMPKAAHEAEPAKPTAATAAHKVASHKAAASPEGRRLAATKLVKRYSLYSGVAGLFPMPVVDIVAVSGVQYHMLQKLSEIYDVPFSENRGKALIAGLAGTFIPASSGLGAASLFKTIPVVGSSIGALTMPTLSAGATYAIGMAFVQHFISGGTLLDFRPSEYREFIKAWKKETYRPRESTR